MAKLTPESAWEFADAIKAIVKPQTTRRKATVQNVDKDGTIWVNLPGSSTVTPIQSTGANVSPGDTVLTELRGTSLHITENQTNPAIGENTARSIARQETQHAEAMAKQAKTIADEANAVAEATNQHFFADTNGAHITDVTQDEWTAAVADNFSDYDPDTKPYHNQLLNSLGILLRTALNNLVSITRSAIAFYDGTGNAASNIVARFGSAGAQIGASSSARVELDSDSLSFTAANSAPMVTMSVDPTNAQYWEATFTGDGTTRTFVVGDSDRFECEFGALSGWTVTVDGEPPSSVTYIQWRQTGNIQYITGVFFNEAPADGSVIVLDVAANAIATLRVGSTQKSGSGNNTISAGFNSLASGDNSIAVGNNAVSSGSYSAAFGSAHALADYSLAAGLLSSAQDSSSVAMGDSAKAKEHASVAIGTGVEALSANQTVLGKYNEKDANDTYALIIGNGTAEYARSNAAAVTWLGEYIAQGWAGITQMFAGAVTQTVDSDGVATATGAPRGWLMCDGAAVSRTEYAVLFAAIGTTWGAGDGSTTFNLPDLRGRAPIGAGTGSGLTARTLGGKLGSEYLQAHTHAFTNPTITTHFAKQYGASGTARDLVRTGGTTTGNPSTATGGAVGAVTGVTTGNDGNMQPSAVVNFIIHTGKTS